MASFTYDVYLSFRGEDTRMGFTSHLFSALSRRGIRTAIDDAVLLKGEEVAGALIKAIEQSRIAIIVFSQNYAFSKWCLDELTTILEFFEEKNNGRLVLPVFYGVDPSDVRRGRGSYGEALAKHEERSPKEKVNKWRIALQKAAELAGFRSQGDYVSESDLVESIAKEVYSMITRVSLHVADYPVGLESRVDKVNSLLNLESDDGVHMVGICGIGGIGKTTLARAVYNSISYQFDGLCFLEDVRENTMKYGLVHQQEAVLSVICGDVDINIQNVNEGISMIRYRVYRKKVLLVLDDVDKRDQLEAIAGTVDWFGRGSRVIITTRDMHLLARHGVGRIYEVEELSEKEALDLFCWNAFKTDKVDPRYADVVKRALACASRLPLALQVLGSNLFGKSINEWNDALDRYEKIADYQVGLESRVDKANSLLNLESDGVVHMVGIHGIGGIGKTTIARAVYNSIHDLFEGLCFLDGVSENTSKFGLVHLQETVLSKICGDVGINIQNVNEGASIIRQRLHQKKVLLVLDDVDEMEQLEAIAGTVDWFGPGSRVIITTRDMHLLAKHGVKGTYEVEELSDKEALDFLSWNAFQTDKVDARYADVVKRALACASGLPFALKILGSNLFGKSIQEWHGALDKFEKVTDQRILRVLKISFDSLEEEEKKIFLDIACFFNGHKLLDVEDILWAHYGMSVKYSIQELTEKSLIKIDDGLVTLHKLIQDMGREIVRQESPHEPGKRSRLWLSEDVVQVLAENSGSSAIESLFLDFPKGEVNSNGFEGEEVYLNGEGLKKMQNLRTLVIRNGRFNKGPTHLPNSLRVLEWLGYPSLSLPNDFHPKKLAILKLPESCLRINEPIQGFICLTVLDFSYCEWIAHIPDVSGLPNLEKLSFKHCENLNQIHESVGYLGNLKILDAAGCKNLMTFPPIRLTSLEQLNLSHCSIMESFPEILGKMENVTALRIVGSPIKELPFSIQNLNRLQKLELHICGIVQLPRSIVMLSELGLMCVSRCEGLWLSKQDKGEESETKSSKTEHLILSYCNISDDFFPVGLTWFANVKALDLSGNNFTIFPACIIECHFLRNLKLDDCRLIQEIAGIPRKLETFSAKGCISLKYMDLAGECHSLRELILDDCVYLREIKGDLPNLDHFSAKNCTLLTSRFTSTLMNQESVEAGNKMFSLPGKKIPDWFAHCTSGESIAFLFRNKFPAISLCLVIGHVDEQPIKVKFSPEVFINGNKLSLGNQIIYEFMIATDHILLFDVRLLKFEDDGYAVFSDNEWNRVVVSYADHITDNGVPIRVVAKFSGIHLIKQISGMGDIQFSNPRQIPPLGLKIMTKTPHKDQTRVLSPTLTSNQSPSPPAEAEKGLVRQPTFPVKTSGDVERETSERLSEDETSEALSEDEVCATRIQNDPPVIQRCRDGDDVELKAVSSEESSSNTEGSDSDDPFDLVNRKLCVSGKETTSSGASSGDASVRSIREAINALELLMVKDLFDVSADPAMQSELHQLLDLLSTSSHPKVTVEVKEAIVEFKRKAFASFQEFQATVESVNKLKNFEKHLARIQQETVAGKGWRKDLKNSIKRVSLAIKAENSRKKELEVEIATLRKQLATKERDFEQLVLNLKNQEGILSTYSTSYASLNEHAQALLKEADDLLAASSGIKHDGEAAEVEQSRLKWTWSIDLTSQLNKMKNDILGFYE